MADQASSLRESDNSPSLRESDKSSSLKDGDDDHPIERGDADHPDEKADESTTMQKTGWRRLRCCAWPVAAVVCILLAIVVLSALLIALLPIRRVHTAHGTNATLPSFPLAVKSPYLSAWVPGNQAKDIANSQPEFWTGSKLTWPVLARVDGQVYSLFGNNLGPTHTINSTSLRSASTVSVNYTSSHTYVQLSADSINFLLDFFSPVLPGQTDYARQSLPYSYLTVSAYSSSHRSDVQILSAIDYSWTAQEGSSVLNFTTSSNTGFFWFHNPDAIDYSQKLEMASYGSVVFGSTTDRKTTHGCDTAQNIYSAFISKGSLTPPTTCAGDSLAALAKDLGQVGFQPSNATFVIGFDRENAINYLGASQTGAYKSQWPTIPQAVEYVLNENYAPALNTSLALDAEVRRRAEQISDSYGAMYADILEASVRQTFAAMELTVPSDNLTAAPVAFIKEISSDGNVNTVDIIFQTWPIFVSLNPEYIPMLLQPILSYVQQGQWPHPWLIHDMGTHYPNATGHHDGVAESLPVFETSSLFILLYAYQQYTGDTSVTRRYGALLEDYAKWLLSNSLYPSAQLTSVDAIKPTPNQTALAVQGAIALNAASNLTGNTTYHTAALSHADLLYTKGLGLDGTDPSNSTHFTYNYHQPASWSVLYSSYSDVLLKLNTFPASAWEMQSSWYERVNQPAGLPYASLPSSYPDVPKDSKDSKHPTGPDTQKSPKIDWGLTDWNIEAAAVSSDAVQNAVVSSTHAFMMNGLSRAPFGTKYFVMGPRTGKWIADRARSTVGTHFAILAEKQGWWWKS